MIAHHLFVGVLFIVFDHTITVYVDHILFIIILLVNNNPALIIASILSEIQEVPPKEWTSSCLRAMNDVFMLSWPIFLASELFAFLYFVDLHLIGREYAGQLAGTSLAML